MWFQISRLRPAVTSTTVLREVRLGLMSVEKGNHSLTRQKRMLLLTKYSIIFHILYDKTHIFYRLLSW